MQKVKPGEVKNLESQIALIPAQGLFPPGSMVWKINRDSVILLGGLRALIMQIAHPLIAQGVADHSHFQKDPIGRLKRTLKVVLALAFGDRETIGNALGYLQKVHIPVKGQLAADTEGFLAEKKYSADDHNLRFWVFATLVESSLTLYQQLLKPLSNSEKEQYYQENLRIAELLNISVEHVPENYPAFDEYFQNLISGEQISVNETGKKLAEDIFHPQIAFVPRIFHWPVRCFTVGLLPSVVRDKFNFRWSIWHQGVFSLMLFTIKLFVWIIPVSFRTLPSAKKVKKRWKDIASE